MKRLWIALLCMIGCLPALGQVIAEETVVLPEERPYEVTGDLYRSKTLSLAIRKPAEWQFLARLAASMEDGLRDLLERLFPDGKITYFTYRGSNVLQITSGERSATAIARGQDVWLILVQGANARELLRE